MPIPVRVLIVEDNPDDLEILKILLRRGGYEVSSKRVETAAQMQAAIREQEWDLVLSDYSLPQFSAPAAFEILKQSGLDIPFIVVTGTMGEDLAVAAMRSGVSDYLIKDNLARLCPAIERELRETRSRASLRVAEQSVRHLAAIVLASNDAIVSTTLDDVITSWNPAAERLFGWTSAEIVGRSIAMLVPPDRRDELMENTRRLHRGERVDAFETVRLNKAGMRIDILLTLSPIYEGDGQLIGMSRIARDISDRKRAEEALRASEERFRAVVDSDLIAIGFWNKAGAFTDGNDAFLRIVGHTRADLQAGKVSWRELTPSEHRALDDRAIEQIEKTGCSAPYEKDFVRKDGVRVPVFLAGAWPAGQEVGVAYFVDISERKRAEAALHASEERFHAVLESDLIAIGFWNKAGAFIDGNDAFLKMIGHARADLQAGKVLWRDLTPADERVLDDRALKQIERSGRCAPYEKHFIRKDGSRTPVFLGAAWLPGQDLGMAYCADTSERTRVDEAPRS